MKADKEKQLIEAMKSKYQCRVTAEDIIKQTDFFDNRSSRKVNKFFNYKYAFLTSIFIIILVVTSFTLITITNDTFNKNVETIYVDKHFHVKDDTAVMTEEYLAFMKSHCEKLRENPMYFIQLDLNTSLYIYHGYDTYDSKIKYHYYFYIMNTNVEDLTEMYLQVDERVIRFASNSNCGILKAISVNEIGNNPLLTFTFGNSQGAKTYTFSY